MSGINTDGFAMTGEQSGSNTIDAKYAPNTASAFPAKDMSQQGPAGTTDKMVHTAAETSAFGTGK
jgi:hypothetical protein